MHKRRIERRPTITEPDALPPEIPPVLRRIYAARGVADASALDRGLGGLAAPDELSSLDRAAALVADEVEQGGRILIVGDFDADGATSCALAIRALRAMGATDPDYLVPNRFDYGYGLSPEIVAVARQRAPNLIVTVDNGISSIAGVAAANDAGIPVLVTDHHLPGESLPAATAVVNPNLPGDAFPSKALAGVGVIFYVMLAVRGVLRERGWFRRRGLAEPNLAEQLDLVALGTVADVVPLDRNNRILVEQGLRRIRAGRVCPGLEALLTIAGRDPRRLVASDLAFAAGPRLNAAGRLEDMAVGIECLLSDGPARAQELAAMLDGLNRQRREIEGRMRDDAMAAVDTMLERLGGPLPPALCLADDEWHQGVIGIVASRIKEHCHRPVIAFAPSGDDELKGSARSIPGLHIRDALERVSGRHPGLIPRFGGHAMAAGLSLAASDLERFRNAFETVVSEMITDRDLEGVVRTDGPLAPAEFTLELAETLRTAGPWGQGFPEPVFDNPFRIEARRVVGERHLKLRVRPDPDGPLVDAIAFNALDRGWDAVGARATLAYRLDVNEYRGKRSLQLMVEHIEPLG